MGWKFWDNKGDEEPEFPVVIEGIYYETPEDLAGKKTEPKRVDSKDIISNPEAVSEAQASLLEPPVESLISISADATSELSQQSPKRRGRLPSEGKLVEAYIAKLRTQKRSQATVREYARDLKIWCHYSRQVVGKHPLNLSISDLDRFQQWMAEERQCGPAIIRRRVSSFRGFCRWAKSRRNLDIPAIEMVDRPELAKTEPKDLGTVDFLRIRDECRKRIREDRVYCWTAAMLLGGLRVSELATIRVVDGRLRVMGKGSKERSVPVPEWVWRGIKFHLKKDRKRFTASRQTVWRRIKATWGEIYPHQFRHTFGSELVRRGHEKQMGIEDVQQLMGHASIVSTMVYVKADPDGRCAEILDK